MEKPPEFVKNSKQIIQKPRKRTPVEELKKYDDRFRNRGFCCIAGVDEAGRGPIAGPVVAAAVILPQDLELNGIADSKTIKEITRESLFQEILFRAVSVGIGYSTPEYIDKTSIIKATLRAMTEAVHNLTIQPDLVMIDGINILPPIENKRQIAIVKGDQKSLSIAAASIVAKVFRDRLMRRYDYLYPEYGFKKHKGYPTKKHIEALKTFGPCPIHRKSYKSVKYVQEKERPHGRR